MIKKVIFIVLTVLAICSGMTGCRKTESNPVIISVEPGDHICFGNYKGEDIEWRVLDVKDGNVLLLSEYGLDVKPFNETQTPDIVWEDCTLRQWLNDGFMESAFTDKEKEKILLSVSEGFPEYNDRVPGGNYTHRERETEDYVFLLSYTEVYHYISDAVDDVMGDSARLCYPTDYAKSNPDILLYQDACGWWLCNGIRGYVDGCKPMAVTPFGSIDVEFGVNSRKYAVRPAVWVKW